MAGYRSDYDQYLEEQLLKHPEWKAGQREGLALLWNRKVDLSEQEVFRQVTERQRPYPYDVNF
jgi:hypothetical protein